MKDKKGKKGKGKNAKSTSEKKRPGADFMLEAEDDWVFGLGPCVVVGVLAS